MKNILKKSKFSRRGTFSVLFSLAIFVLAVPFWASALIDQDPYINVFSADAKSGFYVGEDVEFTIKGGDKQDSLIEAELNYGNGEIYRFSLYKGSVYSRTYTYSVIGRYYPTLTLTDKSNRQKGFRLEVNIEGEWQSGIKVFKFSDESSSALEEKVYLNYEIECKNEADYKAQINWGDNEIETINTVCGPTIISHEYSRIGSYGIKLEIKNSNGVLIDTRELRVVISNQGGNILDSQDPVARFFIKTAWPRVNEEVVFADASTDPDGVENLSRWYWTFGDGGASSEQNPRYTYARAGKFNVRMTVIDESNRRNSFEKLIEVFEAKQDDLVRISGKQEVYQIINEKRHWIPTTSIFYNYGFSNNDIRTISQWEIDRYLRAKLLRVTGTEEIYYLTENNMKRKMSDMAIFYSYGNRIDDVVDISWQELNWYETNRLINHNGDWRVYLLENGKKRRIETAEAFNRHGYNWAKIAPINWTEFTNYPEGSIIR